MADEEVGAPEGEFDDLDDKLTRGLRQSMCAEAAAVPLARPPRPVRLVVLEFAREEHRDKELVDGALNGHDGDESQHGVRRVPKLEEPLRWLQVSALHRIKKKTETHEELEEADHTDRAEHVRDSRHNCTEPYAARIQHRSQKERDEEENEQDRGVPYNGAKGYYADTNQGARLGLSDDRERFDEHVRDDKEDGKEDREENLRDDHCAPACTWYVARQLLRWLSKFLLLVPSDHCAR